MKKFYLCMVFIFLLFESLSYSNPIEVANSSTKNGDSWTTVGNKTLLERIPFNFYYYTSTMQFIYLESEMNGNVGDIKKIRYHYNNSHPQTVSKHVKIYMAITELNDLGISWLPQDQFTLVYDGTITIPEGVSYVELELQTPFKYSGGNICMMNTFPMDTSIDFNGLRCYSTDYLTPRQRYYYATSKEFDWTQQGEIDSPYVPNTGFLMADNWVTIGDKNFEERIPFDFYYNSSVLQFIYLKSEINVSQGSIEKIKYHCNNTQGQTISKPVKIYMANTELDDLGISWIPQDKFTLVYDGIITIPEGNSYVELNLTTPFTYSGGNLCVMNERPMDTQYFGGIKFYSTEYSTPRQRHYKSDTQEFNWTQPGESYVYVPNTMFFINPISPEVPSTITSLQINPISGTNNASITFNAPILNLGGTTLSSISKIEVFRNDVSIKKFENPILGSSLFFTDNVDKGGLYKYKFIAHNESGAGEPLISEVFVGEDVPASPTNVILIRNNNSGVITWTAPTTGTNNGWINNSALRYTITRLPDNVVVAENITANTYTDNSIQKYDIYRYKIQSITDAGNGGSETSNKFAIGQGHQPTYNCPFTSQQMFDEWTAFGKDNIEWRYYDDEYNKGKVALLYPHDNKQADAWLISPPMSVEAGKTYRLKFDVKNFYQEISYFDKMKVFYGNDPTIESQTTLLADYQNINYGNYITKTIYITSQVTDIQFFSFYAYSLPGKAGLWLTNVVFEEVLDNEITVMSITGTTLPIVNNEYKYYVNIKNDGIATQTNYTVQLLDENNNILSSVINPSIAFKEAKSIPLTFTPTASGEFKLKGRVIFQGTQIDTDILKLNVQAEGNNNWTTIEQGTIKTNELPICFFYNSYYSQSVYLKNEIGFDGGYINKLVYKYEYNGLANESIAIKIYMANTNQTELTNGWVPSEYFSLVYDGNISYSTINDGEFTINLETPFVYTGTNLCIAFEKPNSDAANTVSFYSKYYDANRSRRTGEGYLLNPSEPGEFDFTQVGTVFNYVPNVRFQIDTNITGKIAGSIKSSGEGVEDVNVKLNPINTVVNTDVNGSYEFNYVPEGIYSMVASKYGYETVEVKNVESINLQTTIVDFDMPILPSFRVEGTVKDNIGNLISNATITINGYDNYSIKSDVNGKFAIDNVYKSTYSIVVKKDGFVHYNGSFNVVDANVTLSITLPEYLIPAANAVATYNDDNVNVSWDKTCTDIEFRYDDGECLSQLGFYEGTYKSIMGSVYRTPAVLSKMSWYQTSVGGPHSNVVVYVLDLDENGMPSSTVLYTKQNVPTADDAWSTHTFTVPVECPRGFMIAIGVSYGFMAIGTDSGVSDEYPFVENVSYYSGDYTTGIFQYNNINGDRAQNFMIRAEGYSLGAMKSTDRSLVGYKVWRLKDGSQSDENSWALITPTSISETSYIDNKWDELQVGYYKYAVKAVYSGDNLSIPIFSNTLSKRCVVNIEQPLFGKISIKVDNVDIKDGDKVDYNKEITIVAIPESALYKLDYITINGEPISGNKYKVTEDVIVVSAVFVLRSGISEESESDISIYPNPVQNTLNIVGEYSSIEMYNSVGKMVLSSSKSPDEVSVINAINVHSLADGVYFLKIYNREQMITKKIIIRK